MQIVRKPLDSYHKKKRSFCFFFFKGKKKIKYPFPKRNPSALFKAVSSFCFSFF